MGMKIFNFFSLAMLFCFSSFLANAANNLVVSCDVGAYDVAMLKSHVYEVRDDEKEVLTLKYDFLHRPVEDHAILKGKTLMARISIKEDNDGNTDHVISTYIFADPINRNEVSNPFISLAQNHQSTVTWAQYHVPAQALDEIERNRHWFVDCHW